MEHADFIHHVRLNEYQSAEDPQGYRRKVAVFAAVGHAWIALCLIAGLALGWWGLSHLLRGQVRPGWIFILLGGAGLAWSSLRSLFVRLDAPPTGVRLTREEAPALFKLISQVRRKVHGPRLHEVYIDDQFNASISQLPRRGLMGGHLNRLQIGLPLMMALDVPRLSAVLAHEYGHLRGNHGRFAAWIYRTRLSWMRMNDHLADENSLAGWLNGRFMRWYVPRFLAQSFALARQDEYEADRISAKLVGAQTAGAALIEIDLKAQWLQERFWPRHWQAATDLPQPQGPFKALRHLLNGPLDEAEAREHLRRSLRQLSGLDDTHPVLKDRLEALQLKPALPAWSRQGALALLGTQADALTQRFDQQWCRDQATLWKAHHQRQTRLKERAQDWRARANSLGTEELVMWGICERRLQSDVDVGAVFARALERNPAHAEALRGLFLARPEADPSQAQDWLERVWQAGAIYQGWAARRAVALLERPQHDGARDEPALKRWRQRLKDTQTTDSEVWDALCTPPWFDRVARHDLNELDLEDVVATVSRHREVQRAWLVQRRLPEHTQHRAFLLLLELPKLSDPQRYALCRQIEQQMDLPGPTLVLWAGENPTLADIERNAFTPIYSR